MGRRPRQRPRAVAARQRFSQPLRYLVAPASSGARIAESQRHALLRLRGGQLNGSEGLASLRVIATTDIHVNLLPYDYFNDRPAAGAASLAALSRLVGEARAGAGASVLLDNGDFLQGNPMGETGRAQPAPAPHPAILAMNHLGYDAAGLGNHEFNYGLPFLRRALSQARFPAVASNLRLIAAGGTGNRRGGRPFFRRFVLLERPLSPVLPPVRIGVIGFTPPQILQWDRRHLHGRLAADDILDAAPAAIAKARQAGAEIVIALCHSGIAPVDTPCHPEAAAAHLALLPGLDAVICGHSHRLFPVRAGPAEPGVDHARATLGDVPAVMPGANASHLGIIDLDLVHEAGTWRRAGHRVTLHPAPAEVDAGLAGILDPAHRRTLRMIRRRVGRTDVPLHSHFALLGRSTALSLVAEAQARAARLALAAAGQPAHLPLLSAIAPFKAGGNGGPGHFTDIPAGNLHLSHAADLYLFPNDLAVIEIDGAGLRDWLEHAASVFVRVSAGRDPVALIDPDFPGYNSDMIHGLDCTIDLSVPPRHDRAGAVVDGAARRVTSLRHAGREVSPADRFLLATNSYRVSGSGGYLAGRMPEPIDIGRITLRAAIIDHLQRQSPVRPRPGPGFRLIASEGGAAILRTAPAALRHLDEIADYRPRPLRPDAEGYLPLVLTFG